MTLWDRLALTVIVFVIGLLLLSFSAFSGEHLLLWIALPSVVIGAIGIVIVSVLIDTKYKQDEGSASD